MAPTKTTTPADETPATDTTTDTTTEQPPTDETPATGAPLGWDNPEHQPDAQPEPESVVEEVEQNLLNLPIAHELYVLGLETELALYGHDAERKAAIVAELDRVRGGKAVTAPKETR